VRNIGRNRRTSACSRLCALLAAQDRTFYRHHGIGLGDSHFGHTTLTQSIGKGLFFKRFDPGLLRQRKVRLMVAAFAFDQRISKETQLRLFLNRGDKIDLCPDSLNLRATGKKPQDLSPRCGTSKPMPSGSSRRAKRSGGSVVK